MKLKTPISKIESIFEYVITGFNRFIGHSKHNLKAERQFLICTHDSCVSAANINFYPAKDCRLVRISQNYKVMYNNNNNKNRVIFE